MTANGGAKEIRAEHKEAEDYELLPLPTCPYYGWGVCQKYWWEGVRAQREIALTEVKSLKKDLAICEEQLSTLRYRAWGER